jgi:hypothetical protein
MKDRNRETWREKENRERHLSIYQDGRKREREREREREIDFEKLAHMTVGTHNLKSVISLRQNSFFLVKTSIFAYKIFN